MYKGSIYLDLILSMLCFDSIRSIVKQLREKVARSGAGKKEFLFWFVLLLISIKG